MFYLNNIQLNIWAEFKDAIETEFYSNAGYAKPDLQLGRESTSCLISILLVCPLSNFSQLSIQAVRKVLQHHNLMCLFLLLLAGMSEQHSQQKKICATKFFFLSLSRSLLGDRWPKISSNANFFRFSFFSSVFRRNLCFILGQVRSYDLIHNCKKLLAIIIRYFTTSSKTFSF